MWINLITAHDILNRKIKQLYERTKPTALQKEGGHYFSVTEKETSLILRQKFVPTIVSSQSSVKSIGRKYKKYSPDGQKERAGWRQAKGKNISNGTSLMVSTIK